MKCYSERCVEAEAAVRAKCPPGWIASRAWVGVHFAAPETEAEVDALAAVQEFFGATALMPHIYSVAEFAAFLLQREWDALVALEEKP